MAAVDDPDRPQGGPRGPGGQHEAHVLHGGRKPASALGMGGGVRLGSNSVVVSGQGRHSVRVYRQIFFVYHIYHIKNFCVSPVNYQKKIVCHPEVAIHMK